MNMHQKVLVIEQCGQQFPIKHYVQGYDVIGVISYFRVAKYTLYDIEYNTVHSGVCLRFLWPLTRKYFS